MRADVGLPVPAAFALSAIRFNDLDFDCLAARLELKLRDVEQFAQGVRVLPRLVVAVLAAGFVAMLIPSGVVAEHIGPESGVSGVLIAMLVGGFIPSGPIVSFPLVVVLHEAGAGTPQLVALLTAWSCFALHRVMIYEIPLMGLRFGVTRLVSALPLPLISAGITAALLAALG